MDKFALFLFAATLFTLLSCAQDNQKDNAATLELKVTAESPGAKTAINPDGNFSWSGEESLKIIELSSGAVTNYTGSTGSSLSGGIMTFTASLNPVVSDAFSYYGVCPSASAFNPTAIGIDINLPSNQIAQEGSYDPAADVLISEKISTASQPTNLLMRFARVNAIGRLLLTNLPIGIEFGDLVGISISAKKNGNDVPLAGKTTFSYDTYSPASIYGNAGAKTKLYIDPTEASSKTYHCGTSDNYTQVDFFTEEVTPAVSSDPAGFISPEGIYFTCWPFELTQGDKFTITIFTSGSTYSKEITIPAGRSLKLLAGKVSKFTVNMSGAQENSSEPLLVSASFSTSDGDYVFDHNDKTMNILHAQDITGQTIVTVEGATWELTGSWPNKTLSCSKWGYEDNYNVILADYVAEPLAGWTCTWADEFNGTSYDPNTWMRIDARPSQAFIHMDPYNETLVSVESGEVRIWAKKVDNTRPVSTYEGKDYPEQDGYSTGGLTTVFDNDSLKTFRFLGTGTRIDIRAKVQNRSSFWPAIWMTCYPNHPNGNPWGGEIDILEAVSETSIAVQTNHDGYTSSYVDAGPGGWKTHCKETTVSNMDTQWHIYSVEIDATTLKFYIDNSLKYTYNKLTSFPYGVSEEAKADQFPYTSRDFRLVLSAQLGDGGTTFVTSRGGTANPNFTEPGYMAIDYIRYYIK